MSTRNTFLAIVASLCCTFAQGSISVGSNAVSAAYYGTNVCNAMWYGTNLVAQWGSSDVLDGLVAWWKMDEPVWNGTVGEVADSISTNNGIATSATTTNGLINRCGVFDGTASFLDFGNPSGLAITPNNSASFWVKTDRTQNEVYLCHGNYGIGGFYIRNSEFVSNAMMVWVKTSAGMIHVDSSENTLVADEWNFVAFTYDTENAKIYVNGVLSGTTANGGNAISATTESFYVGQYVSGDVKTKGLIDDVRIYNRALSSDEVNSIYQKVTP